ncbi:prepilin-type N-terminal cleavage/methylation domain-containing protein [bacterium]|nr:prepilin-type N-terminal cleavage/methylation domain-containing protein [bacterium]MBU1995368.1 prepilin-type N-terminal cleavage/methylation domain-containing protein [bacterium]
MRIRNAFTMIELVFVIVVIGIVGKFGVEFLAQAYNNFIFSHINHTLQSNSAAAVEFIATRLQHRIKDSTIARDTTAGTFVPLANASGTAYNVLEWVGADEDGFRGNSDTLLYLPNWSGIIDLDADIGQTANITSPQTDTAKINTLIDILSYGNSSIADAALYFAGTTDINGYGWDGAALTNQNASIHPITYGTNANQFSSSIAGVDFSGVDVYEYYKLAWTAYAIVYTPGVNNKGTLNLYYDYQPWNGEKYSDTDKNIKNALIMENVSTFQFRAIGSVVKIQVCVKSNLVEEYSLCKEKTIF